MVILLRTITEALLSVLIHLNCLRLAYCTHNEDYVHSSPLKFGFKQKWETSNITTFNRSC